MCEYAQKVANVQEEQILDRLLLECKKFEDAVRSGEAKLGEKKVDILPPDPIGELGSGWEKIQKEKSENDKSVSLKVIK